MPSEGTQFKVLLEKEKIDENKKIPGDPPSALSTLKKSAAVLHCAFTCIAVVAQW